MKTETIYEPHPVSAERKEELRRTGYRIVDARYAPEGYVHPHAKPEPAKRQRRTSYDESPASEE